MKAQQEVNADTDIPTTPALSASAAHGWRMQPVPLATRWAAAVDPANTWPEYPRPNMVRPNWQNLNGLWEYAIAAKDAPAPHDYAGHILVPYPLESALSGVKKSLEPDQALWYRRTFQTAGVRGGERVLLHFGAVDYEATVYVNGQSIGSHCGGYQSFTLEVTRALRAGDNDLVVKVYDPTEKGPNPRGKQSLQAEWMFYTPSSGIWQTVWLERVPSTYIEALRLTPDVDRSEIRINVALNGTDDDYTVEAITLSGEDVVTRKTFRGSTALRVDRPRLWSPDDPYLYGLSIRLLHDGRVVDTVQSYFGLRKVELRRDGAGHTRIYLNDLYTYNLGVVDQGYWPDGLYTAASDAALKFDVQAIKALGFNTVRKHIKIEPQRWYYHCDQLGLLVWQDMPSCNNDTPQARVQFEREIEDNLTQLHNHPCITTWVLFNEGWGAYDQERLARWMQRQDPSRLLNGHSGPYDQVKYAQWVKCLEPSQLLAPLGGPGLQIDDFQCTQYQTPTNWMAGDIVDMHFYPGPRMFPVRADAASVCGEHGSFGVYVEGHTWNELKPVGRGVGGSGLTAQQMLDAYEESIDRLIALETQGLSGSHYFEIFDVEREHQGFLTYDRALAKVPVEHIERLNARLVPTARNYVEATHGFSVANSDWIARLQCYDSLVAEFRSGQRDLSFLKRLALTALRQGDHVQATEVNNAFIAHAPRPYTREIWEIIIAITHSSKDQGFELLRTHPETANAALGSHESQKKVLQIIQRELIVPYFKDEARKLTWSDFEQLVEAEYGALGREAVCGARMMEDLLKEDWESFATSYVRYFETATPRSPYRLHSLCHRVLRHVSDVTVLDTAIRVMRWQLDLPKESPVFGRYDPTELDTYANLLHRIGRHAEAIEWQQKAVALSDGRDAEIVKNLERMRRVVRSSTDTGKSLSSILPID